MVNLKDFFLSITEKKLLFEKNAAKFLRFIQKNEKEFIEKQIFSIKDILDNDFQDLKNE